jgi:hypothetical protein
MRLLAQSLDRQRKFSIKMTQVVTAEVPHLNVLEMLPDPFVWIQVRRIRRQPLQMNKLAAPLRQESLYFLRAMDRRAIPNYQQPPPQTSRQMQQKRDTLPTRQRLVARQRVELSAHRHATHHRQVVAGLEATQDRRFAARRVSPDHSRQQVKASFINKEREFDITI